MSIPGQGIEILRLKRTQTYIFAPMTLTLTR